MTKSKMETKLKMKISGNNQLKISNEKNDSQCSKESKINFCNAENNSENRLLNTSRQISNLQCDSNLHIDSNAASKVVDQQDERKTNGTRLSSETNLSVESSATNHVCEKARNNGMYYYSPILQSDQTLIRPMISAQPPLYSPLLSAQQHPYPMPHLSPVGPSCFSSLNETIKHSAAELGSSDSTYKEGSIQARANSIIMNASTKSCNSQDYCQCSLEANNKKLCPPHNQHSFNNMSYGHCNQPNSDESDQRVFEDYARTGIYNEELHSRGWDANMTSCGTSTSSTSDRNTTSHNHGSHSYTYPYADCRLDAPTWNKSNPTMSVNSNTNGCNQDQSVNTAQPKASSLARGTLSNHQVQNDSSISRSPYDYQNITSYFPYLSPFGYQHEDTRGANHRNDHNCNQIADQAMSTSNKIRNHLLNSNQNHSQYAGLPNHILTGLPFYSQQPLPYQSSNANHPNIHLQGTQDAQLSNPTCHHSNTTNSVSKMNVHHTIKENVQLNSNIVHQNVDSPPTKTSSHSLQHGSNLMNITTCHISDVSNLTAQKSTDASNHTIQHNTATPNNTVQHNASSTNHLHHSGIPNPTVQQNTNHTVQHHTGTPNTTIQHNTLNLSLQHGSGNLNSTVQHNNSTSSHTGTSNLTVQHSTSASNHVVQHSTSASNHVVQHSAGTPSHIGTSNPTLQNSTSASNHVVQHSTSVSNHTVQYHSNTSNPTVQHNTSASNHTVHNNNASNHTVKHNNSALNHNVQHNSRASNHTIQHNARASNHTIQHNNGASNHTVHHSSTSNPTVQHNTRALNSTIQHSTRVSSHTVQHNNTGAVNHTVQHNTGASNHTVQHNTDASNHTVQHNTGTSSHTVQNNTGSSNHTVQHNTGASNHTVQHNTGTSSHTVQHNTGSSNHTVQHNTGTSNHTVQHNTGASSHTVQHNTGSSNHTVQHRSNTSNPIMQHSTRASNHTVRHTGSLNHTTLHHSNNNNLTFQHNTDTPSNAIHHPGSSNTIVHHNTGTVNLTAQENTGRLKHANNHSQSNSDSTKQTASRSNNVNHHSDVSNSDNISNSSNTDANTSMTKESKSNVLDNSSQNTCGISTRNHRSSHNTHHHFNTLNHSVSNNGTPQHNSIENHTSNHFATSDHNSKLANHASQQNSKMPTNATQSSIPLGHTTQHHFDAANQVLQNVHPSNHTMQHNSSAPNFNSNHSTSNRSSSYRKVPNINTNCTLNHAPVNSTNLTQVASQKLNSSYHSSVARHQLVMFNYSCLSQNNSNTGSFVNPLHNSPNNVVFNQANASNLHVCNDSNGNNLHVCNNSSHTCCPNNSQFQMNEQSNLSNQTNENAGVHPFAISNNQNARKLSRNPNQQHNNTAHTTVREDQINITDISLPSHAIVIPCQQNVGCNTIIAQQNSTVNPHIFSINTSLQKFPSVSNSLTSSNNSQEHTTVPSLLHHSDKVLSDFPPTYDICHTNSSQQQTPAIMSTEVTTPLTNSSNDDDPHSDISARASVVMMEENLVTSNSHEPLGSCNANAKKVDPSMNAAGEANESSECIVCGSQVFHSANMMHHLNILPTNVENISVSGSNGNNDVSLSMIDHLTTVGSKISVADKLAFLMGSPLPRDLLQSHSICSKCFHHINEIDVLEHKLSLFRKDLVAKLEESFQRRGSRQSFKKSAQNTSQNSFPYQQQLTSYPNQVQQHNENIDDGLQGRSNNEISPYIPSQIFQSLQSENNSSLQHLPLPQDVNPLQSHSDNHSSPNVTNQIPVVLPDLSTSIEKSVENVSNSSQFGFEKSSKAKNSNLAEIIPNSNQVEDELKKNWYSSKSNSAFNKSNIDSSLNVQTKSNVDCDIDIEECDNLNINHLDENGSALKISEEQNINEVDKNPIDPDFQNVPEADSNIDNEGKVFKQDLLNDNFTNSETCVADVDINDKPRCNEDLFSVTATSINATKNEGDAHLYVNSPISLDHKSVEDATEYHKPTLLGKNVKTKKHAKLQICRQCDKIFSNRQALVRHIERRHKAFAFHHNCDTCHKKFNSEKALIRHKEQHKSHKCKLCEKVFLQKSKLRKHFEEHAQECLNCEFCDKECNSVSALINHIKTHTKEKKIFKCDVCSKVLANKRNLVVHNRTHTKEQPFSCENCQRKFSNHSNMVNHHKLCTGQNVFVCSHCNRNFALESVYRRHLEAHQGKFSHLCSVCGKGFNKASALKAHFVIHDNQKPSFTCQVCGAILHSSSGYSSHIAAHTNKSTSMCSICGKTFARKSDLQDHIARHAETRSYQCSQCSSSFYYKSNLRHHIQSSHQKLKPFQCTYCDKTFVSKHLNKEHLKTHTGERPFQCKSCGKTFAFRSNYTRHLKCHHQRNVPDSDLP